ncbi:MAG: ferrous iron transport protein B [Clostridia bacterium]|nr:ferrous iron transport protein B [Clostridia bacterium]
MNIKIALAGNPNCGKTTLYNALTGSNQFVGNWPGVTVEKKEGNLKKHDGVIVTDLPGIYSLSPYTLEEVVARNYLVNERPDVILNIVDGTNLERNLYLTTQLAELGIPLVVAVNMMDVVRKKGDKINTEELSRALGCPVLEISALKEDGIFEAAEIAIETAKNFTFTPMHIFSGAVEHAIAHIEEAFLHDLPEDRQRWYAIKIFERDSRVIESLAIPEDTLQHIEKDILATERELGDDAESIIPTERYDYVDKLMKKCYKTKHKGKLSTSDKIDRVVTNRFAALPIFAAVMFLVYFISVTTVGTWVTDFTNDGLFGDGFHLFGIGSEAYTEKADEYAEADEIINGFIDYVDEKSILTDENIAALHETIDGESKNFNKEEAKTALLALSGFLADGEEFSYNKNDEETLADITVIATKADLLSAIETAYNYGYAYPDPANDGVWVPGVPVLVEKGLDAANSPAWLKGVLLNGVVAGVGAVLGFVPQILLLFLFLAFLEACGYMSRIAFVLDRIFRKFGLSGKSFIPMLIGTGCSVPGIMASRTIENLPDRRMTIITTSFMPCGAKLPFIAMIAGAIFGGAWWVAPSAYFIGMFAIILSGIMLKKTKAFSGEPSPFVLELPAYHMPTFVNVIRSMWERGWSFIKKAGTVILLSTVVIWFFTYFGFTNEGFRMLSEEELDQSILASIGSVFSWIFAPLGFGTWQATVASVTGLVAKENIVGTMGIFYTTESASVYTNLAAAFTSVSAYAFLVFNLLCAPCFAAMGAIRREMNSAKWTAFAILYQCCFAYAVALIINQFGNLFLGNVNIIGVVAASLALAFIIFMLVKPAKKTKTQL